MNYMDKDEQDKILRACEAAIPVINAAVIKAEQQHPDAILWILINLIADVMVGSDQADPMLDWIIMQARESYQFKMEQLQEEAKTCTLH